MESVDLDRFKWIPQTDKKVRNSKVWDFMGMLSEVDPESGLCYPIDDQLYCKFCLEDLGQEGQQVHFSKIYTAKKSTATGNHLSHAAIKHGMTFPVDKSQPRHHDPSLSAEFDSSLCNAARASGSKRRIAVSCNNDVSSTKVPALDCLQWSPQYDHKVRNSRVWQFMGVLSVLDPESGNSMLLDDQLYCKFCLEEQQQEETGNFYKIYTAKKSTATGNHISHASSRHFLQVEQEQTQQPKDEISWLTGLVEKNSPALNQYDFNRDLATYLCRDLVPFRAVENPGFSNFLEKNTSFALPSSRIVASTALHDLYAVAKRMTLSILASSYSGTLMIDTWTAKQDLYVALRISVVSNWQFEVLTLSVQPLADRTSQTLCEFVEAVLVEFMPHHKSAVLFNTTDGSGSKQSVSSVLGHERIDCTAHCLHLLLVVDGMNRVPELTAVLRRCAELVRALHRNGHVVTSTGEEIADDVLDMFERAQLVVEILSCDDENPVLDETNSVDAAVTGGNNVDSSIVCTRWNSALTLVEFVLDSRASIDEALCKIQRLDISPTDDDVGVLRELRAFLSSFKSMTLLVSECNPNLSLLPLLRTRIRNACEPLREANNEHGAVLDSAPMRRLKKLIMESADERIKINELVKLASCFDPGVRNVVLSNGECRALLQTAYEKLYAESSPVRHVFVESATDGYVVGSLSPETKIEPEEDNGETSAKKLRQSLLQDTAATGIIRTGDFAQPFVAEMDRYLSYSVNEDSPALEFWRKYETNFPIMSKMAQIYLAVSPGSVPVECLFNNNGLLLNSRRSSIAPYQLNMTTFIQENHRFVGDYFLGSSS